MIYHDRIDVSEGIDVIKTSTSKECDICDYWYFLDEGLSSSKIFAMGVMMYQWYLLTLTIFLF